MESVRAHWNELPGISQMHVSRLLTGALDYLRERIGEPRGAAPARG